MKTRHGPYNRVVDPDWTPRRRTSSTTHENFQGKTKPDGPISKAARVRLPTPGMENQRIVSGTSHSTPRHALSNPDTVGIAVEKKPGGRASRGAARVHLPHGGGEPDDRVGYPRLAASTAHVKHHHGSGARTADCRTCRATSDAMHGERRWLFYYFGNCRRPYFHQRRRHGGGAKNAIHKQAARH